MEDAGLRLDAGERDSGLRGRDGFTSPEGGERHRRVEAGGAAPMSGAGAAPTHGGGAAPTHGADAESAAADVQPDLAIDTRSYDWRVFDESGWVYLLPPLRGSRLLCVDPVGNVAHRLASEGADVTVVVAEGSPPWDAALLDPALRPTIHRLCFVGPEDVAGAGPEPARYDGLVFHDLAASHVSKQHVPALVRMLRGLARHLDAEAFVYIGARRLWSPWRLFASSGNDAGQAGNRGVTRRQLVDLVRAAGARTHEEHPYLLSGPNLVEVLGPRGYRSMKNRERPAERVKEMLLGPWLATYLAPGLGVVAYVGQRRASVIDLVRSRLASPGGQPHRPRPTLRQCLVLHAGKVVLGLGPPAVGASPVTVVLTGEAVAIRRREAEAVSLAGLAALPPRLSSLVPQWLGRIDVQGVQAFVQSTRPGVTCDQPVPFLRTVTHAAADYLVELHRQTSNRTDRSRLPALMSALCTAGIERIPGLWESLSRLRETIGSSAAQLDFPLVWMHGDFKVENVMYDQRSGALTGVIDWELSMPKGLPLLDLLYLLAFNRMIRGQNRFEAFRALSLGEGLDQEECDLISDYLRRLEIPEAQRLPLAIAFVCHDIGCRIQWDVLPPAALRRAAGFLDDLRTRLVAWQCSNPSLHRS